VPTPASDTASSHTGHADLENLAAELATRGYHTDLCTPPGTLPYLHVVNPQASALTENVFAHADSFYYSWAEPIAQCDQITAAASILARVLRTVDGGVTA
jgi:hypothetical protein